MVRVGSGRVGSGCGLLAYWAGPRVGEEISKYGKVLNPGAWCSRRAARQPPGAQCFFDALQCVMFDGTMNLSIEKGE